jgi:hypothetical protein
LFCVVAWYVVVCSGPEREQAKSLLNEIRSLDHYLAAATPAASHGLASSSSSSSFAIPSARGGIMMTGGRDGESKRSYGIGIDAGLQTPAPNNGGQQVFSSSSALNRSGLSSTPFGGGAGSGPLTLNFGDSPAVSSSSHRTPASRDMCM